MTNENDTDYNDMIMHPKSQHSPHSCLLAYLSRLPANLPRLPAYLPRLPAYSSPLQQPPPQPCRHAYLHKLLPATSHSCQPPAVMPTWLSACTSTSSPSTAAADPPTVNAVRSPPIAL